MALYDYYCYGCGKTWEDNVKIADRLAPTEAPCPHCGSVKSGPETGVDLLVGAPFIGDSVRMGITKPRGDFKEVLKNIKRNNRGSTLDV